MSTEALLDLCETHRVYAHYYHGRWFVALGDFFGFGKTLPEALENWCKEVERRGIA